MILQLSMSALRLHATTMGIVLILKQVILVFVNLDLMAKDASQVSWFFLKIMTIAYTRQNLLYGMLYKLQGLANLIHVTTMVHVSLTECLHFAHVWRDSLGKIVHKVNLNYLFSILHHSLFGTCFRFTIILAVRGLFFNYKTWMSVCMTHVMTTSLAKTQSVAMNVCPVPRLTIVLTNRVSICKYYWYF